MQSFSHAREKDLKITVGGHTVQYSISLLVGHGKHKLEPTNSAS